MDHLHQPHPVLGCAVAIDAALKDVADVEPGFMRTGDKREALLLRRMDEAEFQFRNICDRCGGRDRPGANAPFDPIGTLRAPRR